MLPGQIPQTPGFRTVVKPTTASYHSILPAKTRGQQSPERPHRSALKKNPETSESLPRPPSGAPGGGMRRRRLEEVHVVLTRGVHGCPTGATAFWAGAVPPRGDRKEDPKSKHRSPK